MTSRIEISVVMPCLNEEDTVGICIKKAFDAFAANQIIGEVIVADNGSTDRSVVIATSLGARVVHVAARGYGNALMGGIAAASGKYVIMGDADDSYDFLDIYKFVGKLREGYDLVQGCRLPAGGGTVKPGAMPFSHRWVGNPLFSFLARVWFRSPIHDVYCGMRGFKKSYQQSLEQRCTGMEFATEMIIKASLNGARIAEVPITLHPDGRKSHAPHLRTIRDGWRTLRFFMLCSPKWIFLFPGLFFITIGVICSALGLAGLKVGPANFDAHTLLFGNLAILLGYQAIVFAIMTKAYAISERFVPNDQRVTGFLNLATLEKGLISGAISIAIGALFLGKAVLLWYGAAFGPMDYGSTMRMVIPGATLVMLGTQTIFYSFLTSMIGINRK